MSPSPETWKYTVTVPENGAVLILADSCGGDVPHEKISPLADRVVRTDYWYNGRDDGGAHAWVSTKSFVASLGSGNSGRSRGTACAVTLDGMENEKLTVTASHSDGIAGTGAVCGIMTVYRVNGEYARTVYHGFEGAEGKLAVPLGTGREYDEFSVLHLRRKHYRPSCRGTRGVGRKVTAHLRHKRC